MAGAGRRQLDAKMAFQHVGDTGIAGAEADHFEGGGAQAAVVQRGAEAVVKQDGVVLGDHRSHDQLGH